MKKTKIMSLLLAIILMSNILFSNMGLSANAEQTEIKCELTESSMYSTMIRGAKYPIFMLLKNIGTTVWDKNNVEIIATEDDTVQWLQFGGFNSWNEIDNKKLDVTGSTPLNSTLKLDFGIKMPDFESEAVFSAKIISKIDTSKFSDEIRKNIKLRDITKEDLKSAVLEAEAAFNKVTFANRTGAIAPINGPYVINWIAAAKNTLALENPTTQELLTGYNDLYNALSVILKEARVSYKNVPFDATLKANNFPSEMVVGETYNLEFTYESNSHPGFLWGTYGLYKFGLKAGIFNQFKWDGVGGVHPLNPDPTAIFTKKYMDNGVLVDNGQRYTFKFSVTAPDAPTQKCLDAQMFNDYNGSEQFAFGDVFSNYWFYIKAKDKVALSKLIAENNSLITNAKIGTTSGYYSQVTVNILNAAIAVAQGVYNNSSATSDNVILAYNTLRDARNTFKASAVVKKDLDVEIVANNIPDSMEKGTEKDAFITIKNVGTWNIAPKYNEFLAAYSDNDIELIDYQFGGRKTTNNDQHIYISKTIDTTEIKPGEYYTYRFKIKAPIDKTRVRFSVQGANLAYPGVWFGQRLQKDIEVTNKDQLNALKLKVTEFLDYSTIGSGVGEFTLESYLNDLKGALNAAKDVINSSISSTQSIESSYNSLLNSYNNTRALANQPTKYQDSKIVAHTIPSTMYNGESKQVSITFKNLGNMPWDSSYTQVLSAKIENELQWSNFENGGQITSLNDQWAYISSQYNSQNKINVCEMYTFRFTITAPKSGAKLVFSAQLENTLISDAPWFGESLIKSINFIQPIRPKDGKHIIYDGDYIKNIESNLTSSSFLQIIKEENVILSNLTIENKVKTGSVATTLINGVNYSKTVVVAGDTDGDGNVGITDLVKVKKHLLKLDVMNGQYFKAGDINNKGKILISDLIAIKNSLLNISSLIQEPTGKSNLFVFDLENYAKSFTKTKIAYDYVKFASVLQGLMNREKPQIYFMFQNSSVIDGFDSDEYWLNKLTENGAYLSQYNRINVTDFYEIVNLFKEHIDGVVLWDENVPSTSNVASTIAGIENLIPVRYDTTEGSLYNDLFIKYKIFKQSDVKKNLVGKFTGLGTIPDSTTLSTGSAKNDAYIWAKEKYIDTGLSNPMLMTYSIDAFSWKASTYANRGAKIVAYTIPDKMNPGQEAEITITMENTGRENWSTSELFYLGAGTANQFMFKDFQYGGSSNSPTDQRIYIEWIRIIKPGESFTFRFKTVAPNTVGDYMFSTQMVKEGVAWFGDVFKKTITVTNEQNLPIAIEKDFSTEDFYYPNLLETQLTSADYMIANKAFFFDLSPDKNSKPNDDKGQPLGTDYNTFNALMLSQSKKAGRNIFTVNGFVPWSVKYTTFVDFEATLDPVPSEWKMVDIISSYNGQVDASGGLSNASVFSKVPLNSVFTQKNDKGANSTLQYDPNTKYIMYYMGDYDGSAWTTNALPKLWDDPRRGEIPLAWSLCSGLSKNAPQMFNYMYNTMGQNDYFVTGDNGSGYLNPMFLKTKLLNDGLTDFLDIWENYNINLNNKFDLDISGFLIEGNSWLVTEKVQEAYSRMTPKGVFYNFSVVNQFQGETPFVNMISLCSVTTNSNDVAKLINIELQKASQFQAYRCVLMRPSVLADATNIVKSQHPETKIEVVDPYTFMRLFKESCQ